ncbi:hypothetical protein G647_03069 [Cladophialophora carrionii CBS 160.54]|uniref:Uncharacterized protein n=1 Tax=Cladophialophora carrionii CBS 160.54 TaxID=1279043 RepID=V9DK25_9EURO|nr:uncharacterized protein G647_03069 [Cladophialophora carrionii CBS 160.54]ETI26292.1 hypothetical protein G647_03069 [Cladophialophora carrionii CBS 160.54]
MRYSTRELDLSSAIDETFVRLDLIALCIIEAIWSICILGSVAAVISGLSNADANVSRRATATIVVAFICTVDAGLSISPTFDGVRFSPLGNSGHFVPGTWTTLIGL